MPALMCGADGSYLALTWRQISTIYRAAELAAGKAAPLSEVSNVGEGRLSPSLTPRNLSAQLHYAASGNPVSSRPVAAIANCTPGLEVDFRAVWRRVFKGLVLREWDNLVVEMDPDRKLMMAQMIGPSPTDPETRSAILATGGNPGAVAPLEWSNSLARILHEMQGRKVQCDFSKKAVWLDQEWWEGERHPHISVSLEVREFFEPSTAVISAELARPGELTQGLCSPWQNDYRECSCYYWASARPDYVNVEPTAAGTSRGDNWMQKERTGEYVADDYVDSRLLFYDDLFRGWEQVLKFQIRGRDSHLSTAKSCDVSRPESSPSPMPSAASPTTSVPAKPIRNGATGPSTGSRSRKTPAAKPKRRK
jgi:hypothetical protein